MKIYEQITTYIEDGSGHWQEVFRICDEQPGIFANTIGAVMFTGTGLNDMTNSGTYTGSAMLEVIVKIDSVGSPDTFKWSINKGLSWVATGVAITGGLQTLQNGIQILFGATTGHTIDEYWSFSVVGTTNIFDVKDKQEDLDLGTGKLAEDEFKFQINENAILTEENRTLCLEALQFCLDAQNTAYKRYVAYFMKRSTESLSNDNLIFAGVLLPEQQWDDLHIENMEWEEIVDVIREWKFTCRPYYEDLFAEKEFKVVNGKMDQSWNGTAWVQDTTWRMTHVLNRQGYWYRDADNYLLFQRLVNLNKLLRKYADILEQLFAIEGKNITIDFDKTALDGFFRPTRYYKNYVNKEWSWICGAIDVVKNTIEPCFDFPFADPFISQGRGVLKLGIYADETGGDATDDVSPFIQYSQIAAITQKIYGVPLEPNSEKAQELMWENNPNIKSFTDFLYYLALNFGCFLRLYFKSPTQIGIKFISRGSILNSTEVYIRDAVKISGEIQPVDVSSKDKYFGVANYYSDEGQDYYYHPTAFKNEEQSTRYSVKSMDGKRLLLTLSPTVCATDYPDKIFSYPDGVFFYGYKLIPHNIFIENTKGFAVLREKKTHYYSYGIHSAIYMKVCPYTMNSADNREPATDYWTTAGLWQIDNRVYENISDYLNELYLLEEGYYKKELSLEVPYLCNFSATPDGSNPSWQNLKLGSKFVYNGMNFNVVSIRRDFEKKTTAIKLHNSDRFTFGTEFISQYPIATKTIAIPLVNGLKKATSNGDIAFNQVITLNEDGTVSSARSFSNQYKKIDGISIVDCLDGEECYYLTSGSELYSDDWTDYILNLNDAEGITGSWVYLDKDNIFSIHNKNMNMIPRMEKAGTSPNLKDLLCKIGYFTAPNILKLDFSQQWILK
jgi:hypothetical protein